MREFFKNSGVSTEVKPSHIFGANKGAVPSSTLSGGPKNLMDIGGKEFGSATEPQVWALKAYWLSYQLAGLNALVKDMEAKFKTSDQPGYTKDLLDSLQPLIDSSNVQAKKLCDYSTDITDKRDPKDKVNGSA